MMGPTRHGMPGMRHPRPPMRPRAPIPPLDLGLDGPLPLVGSQTNSNDPLAKDSRLFVGNLNTIALSKEAVEAIFSRYGTVVGISMHKGYAFVQYSHPEEARQAGAIEDGKHYAGQAIDINIVSQPKNRSALKRTAGPSTGNSAQPKKARADMSQQRTSSSLSSTVARVAANNAVQRALATASKKTTTRPSTQLTPNSSNILICEMQFGGVPALMQNKKVACTLMLSSGEQNDFSAKDDPDHLVCAICNAEFKSAWMLCQHCTHEHKLSIYKTDDPDQSTNGKEEGSNAAEETKEEVDVAGDAGDAGDAGP